MISKFWNTLFDINENICFAATIYDTEINPISVELQTRKQFFCINPLTQFGRKDTNVTCFRNILVEFDTGTVDEQKKLVEDIGMPYTSCVFSGSKSLHFIISLETPCKDIKEYRRLVKRIQDKIPEADKSTINPSRLSRTPEATRENGHTQTLFYVGERVSSDTLEAWLGPDLKTEWHNPKVVLPTNREGKRLLPTRTLAFIQYGAPPGNRNISLFINACELFRAGYSRDEIYNIAANVLDLPEYEINQCIASAEKAARVG